MTHNTRTLCTTNIGPVLQSLYQLLNYISQIHLRAILLPVSSTYWRRILLPHSLNRLASRTASSNNMPVSHAAPAAGAARPPQLRRNRALLTMVSMALAIAAVPYGMGSALSSAALYGGGQLSMLAGLLVVVVLDGCVAASLAELASRFPSSSGVYDWSYRLLASPKPGRPAAAAAPLAYITGWCWLVGHWTVTLSVNFGLASLLAATVCLYDASWAAAPAWQLLLVFYAACLATLVLCAVGDPLLPYVDGVAAAWNLFTLVALAAAVAATAHSGRHPAAVALGHYDGSVSGWGAGVLLLCRAAAAGVHVLRGGHGGVDGGGVRRAGGAGAAGDGAVRAARRRRGAAVRAAAVLHAAAGGGAARGDAVRAGAAGRAGAGAGQRGGRDGRHGARAGRRALLLGEYHDGGVALHVGVCARRGDSAAGGVGEHDGRPAAGGAGAGHRGGDAAGARVSREHERVYGVCVGGRHGARCRVPGADCDELGDGPARGGDGKMAPAPGRRRRGQCGRGGLDPV
ncbi:amino acid/polyamine transporter I [Cordyceps militaris CM01]|uniref:Amino acid/polyamine transporter I n=1 Tax=Cordyceps militaris (strain CM01) TaxID=983644 RepID=G3JBL8_CORMM|nr:amino acid/polyamine transporter I [Cordyceps militaris CM01]EGX95323.1 amino acid/polyamine transporter I [Cordyceps militaris CM01]